MLDMTVLFLTVLGVVCLIGSIVWFTLRITEEDEKLQRERTLPRTEPGGGREPGPHSGAREFASIKGTMEIEESTRHQQHELVS